MDKVDDTIFNNAMKNAEKELKVLDAKKTPIKKDEQIKETIKTKTNRGTKTITQKKVFKQPDVFKNHPLAKSINKIANSWALSDDVATNSQFGESVVLTIDYYLADLPDHPLLFLAFSGGMVAFAGLNNRGMLPKLPFGEKKEEEKKEEITKPTQTNKLTKIIKKDKSQNIIETKEYQDGKK